MRSKAENSLIKANTATKSGEKGSFAFEEQIHRWGIDVTKVVQGGPKLPEHKRKEKPSIRQYFAAFTEESAQEYAIQLDKFFQTSPSEALIRSGLNLVLFEGSPLREIDAKSYNQPELRLRLEFAGPFKEYDISHLSSNPSLAIKYPMVRRSMADTFLGKPIPMDTDQRSQDLASHGDDLRFRSDLVFAAGHEILPRHLSQSDQVPGHFRTFGICAPFVIVEFKKGFDEFSRRTARYQWMTAARIHLLDRVRIERVDPYSDDPDTRQYGYLICRQQIEIWEMTTCLHQTINRRNSYSLEHCWTFHARVVDRFDLLEPRDIRKFGEFHLQLMQWGIGIYADQYRIDTSNMSKKRGLNSADLTYTDSIKSGMSAHFASFYRLIGSNTEKRALETLERKIPLLPNKYGFHFEDTPNQEIVKTLPSDTQRIHQVISSNTGESSGSEGSSSNGCRARTQNGKPCRRPLRSGETLCGLHSNLYKRKRNEVEDTMEKERPYGLVRSKYTRP